MKSITHYVPAPGLGFNKGKYRYKQPDLTYKTACGLRKDSRIVSENIFMVMQPLAALFLSHPCKACLRTKVYKEDRFQVEVGFDGRYEPWEEVWAQREPV